MINLGAAVTKSTKTRAERDQVIKNLQTIVQFVLDFFYWTFLYEPELGLW